MLTDPPGMINLFFVFQIELENRGKINFAMAVTLDILPVDGVEDGRVIRIGLIYSVKAI